ASGWIQHCRGHPMRDALYHLERSRPASLQAQIREILIEAIRRGQLKAGDPVPSTRAMASRLSVSRNTVTLAYQALVSDGFLASRERSGFYVDPTAIDGMAARPEIETGERGKIDWGPRLAKNPGAQRNLTKPENWHEYAYPFLYGQVDHEVFPIAEWRDCVRQAMGKRWIEAWTEDRFAADDPLLVDEIARRILPLRGIVAGKDEILVTLGAQNALYLIAAMLIGEGTEVALEDPGYPDLRNICSLRTNTIGLVPVDRDGLSVEALSENCELVFTTPSHQFPTTVTMPIERRRALLSWATERDAVIVEDDYEFETNFTGAPNPALKSLDRDGRVIYVGSLSKSLMPGLRLGFIVADASLISELRALRRLMLRHPPGNNQRAAALFLANGHFDVLVRRIHRVYAERWQMMGEALSEDLPGWSTRPGFGGSSYWLSGPDDLDSRVLATAALARGVIVEPGDAFFAQPDDGTRHLRLGFSSIPAAKIPSGIRILKETWASTA
ncbi:MAG: PLP-dependent aminotransferase family protein, partial [Pseudomonadota bacterium]